MSSNQEHYRFFRNDTSSLLVLFKTDLRKRKGQLVKLCQKNLMESQAYQTRGVSKNLFFNELERLKQHEEYTIIQFFETAKKKHNYSAVDIKLFSDKTNWYPCQRQIYEIIFENNGSIKKPHPRHIISLIDTAGNSGKSSFFKWIFYNYSNEVGRISSVSSSKLRSSLINLGSKKIYIIDLPKSEFNSQEEEEDLLAVIEDLKTGIVLETTGGKENALLMEPPHILISFNSMLSETFLRKDKWQIYQLTTDKNLVKVNELSQKKEAKNRITK